MIFIFRILRYKRTLQGKQVLLLIKPGQALIAIESARVPLARAGYDLDEIIRFSNNTYLIKYHFSTAPDTIWPDHCF